MSELIPDTKHFKILIRAVETLIQGLRKDLDNLKNDDADMFTRYLSYIRIKSLANIASICMKNNQEMVLAGHCIHDERLQTSEAIKNGWDETRIKDNPFFVQDDDDDHKCDHDHDHLMDALREAVRSVVNKK